MGIISSEFVFAGSVQRIVDQLSGCVGGRALSGSAGTVQFQFEQAAFLPLRCQ